MAEIGYRLINKTINIERSRIQGSKSIFCSNSSPIPWQLEKQLGTINGPEGEEGIVIERVQALEYASSATYNEFA